jgi:hypothetical protein
MRQGELLGLHWPEVDLRRRRIAVVQSLVTPKKAPPVLEELKTWESRRSVGLVDMAVEALSALDCDTGLVFSSQRNTFLNPSNIVNRASNPWLPVPAYPPSPLRIYGIPPPAYCYGYVSILSRSKNCWAIRTSA